VLYLISQGQKQELEITHPINDILSRSPTLPRHLDSEFDIQIALPACSPNRHSLTSDDQFFIVSNDSLSFLNFYTYPSTIKVYKTDTVETQ